MNITPFHAIVSIGDWDSEAVWAGRHPHLLEADTDFSLPIAAQDLSWLGMTHENARQYKTELAAIVGTLTLSHLINNNEFFKSCFLRF